MKIYFICAVALLIGGAFYMGGRIARTECISEVATAQTNEFIIQLNTQRQIDEKTFHTGMRDVRRVLRTKYTIAD